MTTTRVADERLKCSFYLTRKALWLLEAMADKFSHSTGEVIQFTRTEILEMAVRHMAKAEGIR